MPLTEEQIRIAFETTGTDNFADASAAIGRMTQAFREAGDSQNWLKMHVLETQLALKSEVNQIDAETQAMIEATMQRKLMDAALEESIVTMKLLGEQEEEVTKKGGGMGGGGMRGGLVLSHAIRELASETATATEKMESLARSLPYLLRMFGVGGPWSVAIGVAATGVIELASHWGAFMKALGDDSIERARQQMEAMAKKVDEFNQMMGKPTRLEAEGIKQIQAVMGEITPEDKMKLVRTSAAELIRQGKAGAPSAILQERLEDAQRVLEEAKRSPFGDVTGAQAKVTELQADIAKNLRARAEETIKGWIVGLEKGGEEGRVARTGLEGIISEKLFPGLARRIEKSAPERIKRQRGLEEQAERTVETMEETRKENERLDAEADMLENLGRTNNADYLKRELARKKEETHDRDEIIRANAKALHDQKREQEQRSKAAARAVAHQEMNQARGAAEQAEALARQNKRNTEDMEYWSKYNNGMADAAVQTARLQQILARNTEDMRLKAQEVRERNQQTMNAGGQSN